MPSNALNLYGQSYTQILENVLGDDDARFQLIYPFMSWNWTPASTNQIAAQAYNFLSQIPQWSPLGKYDGSGATVLQAYRIVLDNMQLTVSPALQQAATNARNQVTLAQNQLTTDIQTNAPQAYQGYVNNLPPSVPPSDYQTWMGQSGWSDTIAADSAALDKARATYKSIVSQQNPQWQSLVDATNPPATIFTKKPGWTTMNQGDGNVVSVPDFFLEQDPSAWATQVQAEGGTPVTVSLSGSQQSSALDSSWAKGSVDTASFFSIYVNGSWQQASQMDSDTSLQVNVTLKAVESVPCGPNTSWYNGSFLKASNRPGAFYSPNTPTGGSSPMFGQGGVLPLIITGLVVGYQPSATITMSNSTYNSVSSQFQAASGFRIGPFVFGGGGGSASSHWKKGASGNSFTLESTATYPLILGVMTSMPGVS